MSHHDRESAQTDRNNLPQPPGSIRQTEARLRASGAGNHSETSIGRRVSLAFKVSEKSASRSLPGFTRAGMISSEEPHLPFRVSRPATRMMTESAPNQTTEHTSPQQRVCLNALAKLPGDRYTNIGELARELRERLPELTAPITTVNTTTAEIPAPPESVDSEVHHEEIVLEHFDGFVDSIKNGVALVTLKSREHGDELSGEYSAVLLAEQHIHEQSRFLCRTVQEGRGTRVEIEAIPKVAVTEQQIREIEHELNRMLPPDDDVDY